jgi:hypothetical protein
MKVTVPSFQAQSSVCLGIFYKHEKNVTYFGREERNKKKGKRLLETAIGAEIVAPIVQEAPSPPTSQQIEKA